MTDNYEEALFHRTALRGQESGEASFEIRVFGVEKLGHGHSLSAPLIAPPCACLKRGGTRRSVAVIGCVPRRGEVGPGDVPQGDVQALDVKRNRPVARQHQFQPPGTVLARRERDR